MRLGMQLTSCHLSVLSQWFSQCKVSSTAQRIGGHNSQKMMVACILQIASWYFGHTLFNATYWDIFFLHCKQYGSMTIGRHPECQMYLFIYALLLKISYQYEKKRCPWHVCYFPLTIPKSNVPHFINLKLCDTTPISDDANL